ncbi:MAG: lytic transglycosylase domain-containing protein [Actinobacteria bacterium]|nr:lytic transglycosylase domain-containing protein [Actinomycetota bacterium]
MTDSDLGASGTAGASGTGRHAAPALGRHRASGPAPAHRAPGTTPTHRAPDGTDGRPGTHLTVSRLLAGRLTRVALAGVAVATLAAGVLVATSSADTPTHPAAAPPAGTPAPLTGPAQLSVGAPRGATLLTATPVHARRPAPATPAAVSALAGSGVPPVALNAYRLAAARLASADPGCGVPWSLLAGIGRVESDHGRYGGATLTASGESTPHIVGPALDGAGYPSIADTDGGRLDGDPRVDHAVGPMQFIPATWAIYGADGNGDGVASPFNLDDAALAAARYLCAAGGDLRTAAGQQRAVLAYNHSDEYLALVLATARAYATGTVLDSPVQGISTGPLPAVPAGWLPPANPGRPVALPAHPSGGSSNGGSAGGNPAGGGSTGGVPAGSGSSGTGSSGRSSSGTGSSGSGSSSTGSSGGSSSGTGSSGTGQPVPTSSGPVPASPSGSPSQPPPSGVAGLPVPSISVPAVLPSPTGTGCVKVVLGIAVPVPCGSS